MIYSRNVHKPFALLHVRAKPQELHRYLGSMLSLSEMAKLYPGILAGFPRYKVSKRSYEVQRHPELKKYHFRVNEMFPGFSHIP